MENLIVCLWLHLELRGILREPDPFNLRRDLLLE
jgi:hypothetical protein